MPNWPIDIYLQPLIEELKELWSNGIKTYDLIENNYFTMRAAVLWTINDFPAYGTISGYSTSGYKACPVCANETSSFRIRSKISFMGHRRYLPPNHPWRKSKEYDGRVENRIPPKTLSGEDILKKLNSIWKGQPGKNEKIQEIDKNMMCKEGYTNYSNWRRKSILWELEYWPKLKLRHTLDVMHIEKNICDALVGTILNIEGKSKDNEKARLDLQD